MPEKNAVFIYSEALQKYPYPPDHPFKTDRAPRARQIIRNMGWLSGGAKKELTPRPASRVALKKFHTARYLHALKRASEDRWDSDAMAMGIGSPDCPAFPGLYEHSLLATGATLTAVKAILTGQADVAFNPHGGFHHAHPEKASGFCYVNDVALACQVLTEAGKRVLYIDIDVHNGDGVAEFFYERSDVMTISFHENPRVLFPGTGFEDEIGYGEGKGYCVNVPLPVGTYDLVYQNAFEAVALPLITCYAPDVIVFELGADTLAGDPLAHLQLTNNTYVEVINHLLRFTKPILMTGGGGYQVENTARAWALAWSVLCGADEAADANIGLGGVMLASADWHGGLRDRELLIPEQQRESVASAALAVVDKVKKFVFPLHGLPV
jgi:acetoin utilization protein AcuC